MDTKFTNSIEANRAIMFLYGYIGKPTDPKIENWIRGQYFAEEMYYHSRNGREITVYINSVGGQIYDGMTIIQAVLDCEANTHIVGMAASMAGVIAQFGAERTMNDFAIGMIHPPQGKADRVLEMARAQIKDCLVKNSKLTEKQIDKMTADGAEPHWMDASEMLNLGLVDKIVKTGRKKEYADRLELQKINSSDWNYEEKFKIYDNIANAITSNSKLTPKTHREMDAKIIAGLLGLENSADEATIATKLAEITNASKAAAADKAKVTTLEGQLTELQSKYNALENLQKTNGALLADQALQRATDLVNSAKIAGKIADDAVPSMIELAKTNYDLVKKTIDGIKAPVAHNSVHNVTGGLPSGAAQSVETYENLAKNNPEKLNRLFVENRAEFDRLAKEHEQKTQVVAAN